MFKYKLMKSISKLSVPQKQISAHKRTSSQASDSKLFKTKFNVRPYGSRPTSPVKQDSSFMNRSQLTSQVSTDAANPMTEYGGNN